ncbi:MAG: restriction endonuclease subunit S [Desulfobacteraceae bacterium]|nr:restriction endonuclease subunit S [Desulfobacteraceae bacterium]MDD3990898.1 restriction endonuclease subunit S [Desulfobacteraceae bacterium]
MKWKQKSLDELGYVSRGRSRHRPRDAAHLYGGPYPFVQTGDVKHAGLYLSEYSQTYSEAGLAQSRMWPAGTLCITIAANIADTAILGFEACFPDSVIGFIPDDKKADARFIKYLFGALLQRKYKQFTQGAAQDNLSQAKLLSLKFPIPAITEQKQIAGVLSAYDDLIENNRRRIQLLEQAARLLYKEWFVHLRFPGHEHTKIVDGVPEGWEKKMLGDVAATNAESYKANNLPNEINYIDISSLKRGRILSKNKMPSPEAPGRARRIGADGDVIWSNVRPNLRAYALVLEPDENDVFSTGFTILSPMVIPFSYLYLFATTDEFVGHLVNQTTGASYPAVRPDDFERAEILLPAQSVLKIFHEKMEPAFRMIQVLEKETNALAKARDLLLPKLMNGEVAV